MLKAGFDAASFSCKSCGATVWVEGKTPASAAKRTVAPGGRRRASARGRVRRGRGKTPAGRRGRRQEVVEEQEGGRARYERPKSNANLYIAIGGLAVIVIVVVIVILSQKKEPPPVPPAAQAPGAATAPAATPTRTEPPKPAPPVEEPTPAEAPEERPRRPVANPVAEALAEGDKEENPAAARTSRKFGSTGKREKRTPGTSRWDPPATLGHLKSTPADLRQKIDGWVALLLDPQAGRDSLDAKQKLAAVGKPAFPVLVGAMAKIRDTITDNDTIDERLIESSLKLADECLREMDGWLTSKQKAPIRPGTDKKYITYIVRLHYRRWKEKLEAMPEMPGPYDPSVEYKDEEE
jgi:outer membrane biosynthesis protein TonB